MKKVLLLGVNGQLGSDLQKTLGSAAGIEALPVTRKELDVEEHASIAPFLASQSFDYLVNCTSYHKTDECEDYPEKAFRINGIAVGEMAKACQRYGKVFIHFSTDYVFNGEKGVPYTEHDCPNPLNVYGNSKVAGEHFIQSEHDKSFIFRVSSLFGVAGSSGKGGNFVETMLRLAREGKSLRVVGDQIMSPTHTLDIARAVTQFIREDVSAYGVYHCAGAGQTSWFHFTEAIMKMKGLTPALSPVPSAEYKTKAKRPLFSVLDQQKLDHLYKMPRWEASLEEYFALKG